MITKLAWPLIAASITVALFLLMGYLITPQGGVPQVDDSDTHVVITRTDRDEASVTKGRKKPVKPAPPKKPPPPKIVKTNPRLNKNTEGLTVLIPIVNEGTGFDARTMDRRATPVVRIPPQYPQSLLNRGVEGWVLVEFTITKTGTVEDMQVIDAEPPKVFNRATLRALKRWKYQPQMLDGKAVAQYKMREIFKFAIEKE